ncbi:MAG: signal peptidase II [bacterium]
MKIPPRRYLIVAAFIAALVFSLDIILKSFITRTILLSGQKIVVIPGYLDLMSVENQGTAFGLLHGMPVPVLLIIAAIMLMVFVWLLLPFMHKQSGVFIAGIVIGGAIGNIYDRVNYGFVRDFIYFHIDNKFSWPVFNFADICVVTGIILLMIILIVTEIKAANAEKTEEA